MKRLRALSLFFVGLGSPCAGQPTVAPRSGPIDQAFLTPALAATLGRDGRFPVPDPSYRGTSPARADSIARAAIAFQAKFARPGRTAISTADSAVGSLLPCGRRYYVLPVIDRLPADLPRFRALAFTPRWVIPFCRANGTSPVSVEVADAIPMLTVADGSFVGGVFNDGGEYGVLASGEDEEGYLPLSPEKAALFAATSTGARVAELPIAIMTHPGGLGNVAPAKCMRWRIMLDKPVRLAGEYGEYETREVYVRLRNYCFGEPVLQVADRQQPSRGWIEYPRFGANHDIVSLQKADVVYARPTQFDIVHRVR